MGKYTLTPFAPQRYLGGYCYDNAIQVTLNGVELPCPRYFTNEDKESRENNERLLAAALQAQIDAPEGSKAVVEFFGWEGAEDETKVMTKDLSCFQGWRHA